MKTTELRLLYSYLTKGEDRLAGQVLNLTQTLRYRRFDCVDCLELIIAKERLEAFREFSRDIRALLTIK